DDHLLHPRTAALAHEVAASEGRGRDGCGGSREGEAAPAPDRERHELSGRALEPAGQRSRRSRLEQELVHALEPSTLLRAQALGIDPVVEPHATSSSSTSARCASAARVLVLTVPSGIASRSATSLWERPLQYASAITSRSRSGSRSSARCTRHCTHAASARSSGPASRDGSSGASAGGSFRARLRSTIAFRATPYSHGAPGPRSGLYVLADRHTEANVSWSASSARPRSPSRRSASPNTGRA